MSAEERMRSSFEMRVTKERWSYLFPDTSELKCMTPCIDNTKPNQCCQLISYQQHDLLTNIKRLQHQSFSRILHLSKEKTRPSNILPPSATSLCLLLPTIKLHPNRNQHRSRHTILPSHNITRRVIKKRRKLFSRANRTVDSPRGRFPVSRL